MRRAITLFLQAFGLVAFLATSAAVAFFMLRADGFSARAAPSALEEYIARRVRHASMPARARTEPNPVVESATVVEAAKAHYADHCAGCHAADGSGATQIGKGLYPKAPDMRGEGTQSLSDGELFFVIENGIRFTGMPAWGHADGGSADDSWQLVHLIRRFPSLTPADVADIARMTPASQHAGGAGAGHRHPATPEPPGHHHGASESAAHAQGED